jgi:RNA polymerase sigma-70 factor (sigma-E family)
VSAEPVNAVVDGESQPVVAALSGPAQDPVQETALHIGVLQAAADAAGEAADADEADGDADKADGIDDDAVGADTNPVANGEPSDQVARPTKVTETLAATALVPDMRSADSAWDADRVVTEIYHGEYKSLVRLAVLLVHDVPTAEEVVQDAFEAMHTAWRRLREKEKALSYLRQAVVNKSRSVLRHRTVIDKNAPKPAPDEPSAEHGALALIERSAVIAALRTLPDRQREAVVLRYYADLSEADIAATMGISRGAVKSHTARAMAALKSILELETS